MTLVNNILNSLNEETKIIRDRVLLALGGEALIGYKSSVEDEHFRVTLIGRRNYMNLKELYSYNVINILLRSYDDNRKPYNLSKSLLRSEKNHIDAHYDEKIAKKIYKEDTKVFYKVMTILNHVSDFEDRVKALKRIGFKEGKL